MKNEYDEKISKSKNQITQINKSIETILESLNTKDL